MSVRVPLRDRNSNAPTKKTVRDNINNAGFNMLNKFNMLVAFFLLLSVTAQQLQLDPQRPKEGEYGFITKTDGATMSWYC